VADERHPHLEDGGGRGLLELLVRRAEEPPQAEDGLGGGVPEHLLAGEPDVVGPGRAVGERVHLDLLDGDAEVLGDGFEGRAAGLPLGDVFDEQLAGGGVIRVEVRAVFAGHDGHRR
jgi:hypothetical protein